MVIEHGRASDGGGAAAANLLGWDFDFVVEYPAMLAVEVNWNPEEVVELMAAEVVEVVAVVEVAEAVVEMKPLDFVVIENRLDLVSEIEQQKHKN